MASLLTEYCCRVGVAQLSFNSFYHLNSHTFKTLIATLEVEWRTIFNVKVLNKLVFIPPIQNVLDF